MKLNTISGSLKYKNNLKAFRFILTVFAISFAMPFCFAQGQLQVFSSGGSEINSGDLQGSFTFGETIVLTAINGDITLTQGYQQALRFVVGVRDYASPVWKAYPNPVSSLLFIELPDDVSTLDVQLITAQGQVIKNMRQEPGSHGPLDLHSLTPGMYVLRMQDLTSGTVFQKMIIKK